MTLMQRRRALMGASRDNSILFQLPAPVLHTDSNDTFDSGFNCLEKDMDFTVFVDVTTTYRDALLAYQQVTDGTVTAQIWSKGGGFGVVQWPGGPSGNASYVITKGDAQIISSLGWATYGHISFCVVHQKGTTGVHVLFRFNSYAVNTVDSVGTEWALTNQFSLRSRFKGTLNSMTVYSKALSDSDCETLIADAFGG